MILEDARTARERLIRAEAAILNVEEARELDKKRRELSDLVEILEFLINRRDWLEKNGVKLSKLSDTDRIEQVCVKILGRFIESPKNETLVRNKGWSTLLDTLKVFNAEEGTQQKSDWREYFTRQLFGGPPPEQRKQTITLSLPVNKDAFSRYEIKYQHLAKYRNALPSSQQELLNIQVCSEQLVAINTEFVENQNVPVAVQAFFKAIATASGASLDLLTEDVVIWLRANNMLNNYVVRSRQ